MEKKLYDEMVENISIIDNESSLSSKKVYIFGHCNASLELIDYLYLRGIKVSAILDNNPDKAGITYKEVLTIRPELINDPADENASEDKVVLIASRFYEDMHLQLRELGYDGSVYKVIDYNSYSDYSLSEHTIARMTERERHGNDLLNDLGARYDGYFRVFCPFNALGDIYFMMSYWRQFASKRGIESTVFCVPSRVLADVIGLFGDYPVESYGQKDLDSMIQSVIYTGDKNSFIAHQDRPYVVNLNRALYLKRIPLEHIYCCGVFGLSADSVSDKPKADLPSYSGNERIPKGRGVIFSPYAKSVTAIDPGVWRDAVSYYSDAGYRCYTNVVGEEKPLEGTEGISPTIPEIRSAVEHAGTFVGIRSGLCDILREAKARKIALYPDYNYCDTHWRALDMYYIDQFDHNLLATEEIKWEEL